MAAAHESSIQLQPSDNWTDFYYDIVSTYFWKPQTIGRKKNPNQKSMPWPHWEQKLRSQEEPLNHLVDLLLHICPREMLDLVASQLLARRVTGLQLVRAIGLNLNIVQPDVILSNGRELVFVEMKVDSKSGVDQVGKYGIAALEVLQSNPKIESVELVVLAREAKHQKVWKSAASWGLDSEQAVKSVVIRGIQGEQGIWKEKGVSRYLSTYPEKAGVLAETVKKTKILLADYRAVERALVEYKEDTPVVTRLIDGFLSELRQRNLV